MKNEPILLQERHNSAVAKKVATTCAMTMAMMLSMTIGAFAGDSQLGTINDGVKAGAYAMYDLAKDIITYVSVAFLAWGGVSMLFGGQKGMEEGKKKLILGAAAFLLVRIAPLIVTTLSSWIPESQIPDVFQ